MEKEIKPFADVQLANRYVKVFIDYDVVEEFAKKALNQFIEKFENDEILDERGAPASKSEPMDFLIIQSNGIIASHKDNKKIEPQCVWLKNLEVCDTTEVIIGGGKDILDKYEFKMVSPDFYNILPTTKEKNDKKED